MIQRLLFHPFSGTAPKKYQGSPNQGISWVPGNEPGSGPRSWAGTVVSGWVRFFLGASSLLRFFLGASSLPPPAMRSHVLGPHLSVKSFVPNEMTLHKILIKRPSHHLTSAHSASRSADAANEVFILWRRFNHRVQQVVMVLGSAQEVVKCVV